MQTAATRPQAGSDVRGPGSTSYLAFELGSSGDLITAVVRSYEDPGCLKLRDCVLFAPTDPALGTASLLFCSAVLTDPWRGSNTPLAYPEPAAHQRISQYANAAEDNGRRVGA